MAIANKILIFIQTALAVYGIVFPLSNDSD